jgi:hypothetical protein
MGLFPHQVRLDAAPKQGIMPTSASTATSLFISSPRFAMATISSLSSDQQAVVYRSLFAKADANGDKTVSSEELGNAISSITSTLSQDDLEADEVFAGMDADDDGAVSKSEFTTGLSALVAQQSGSSTTSATQTRAEMIASFRAGIEADIAASLLGSSDSGNAYTSLSEVVAMLKSESGESTTTYSASASTSSNASLIGSLFSESA